MCTNQPLEQCEAVPRQHCEASHKKVPVRVSRRIPKKVCDTAGSKPEVVEARKSTKNQKIVFA